MYYNTNKETGDTLKESREKAETQERKIEKFFCNHIGSFSPDYIKSILFNEQTPLTSIRRAITVLEHKGILEKTDIMVLGTYGKQVHTWRLAYNTLF